MVKKVRVISSRDSLLQDKPKEFDVQHIINSLPLRLDCDPSFTQALRGQPFLAYKLPAKLKQFFIHNNKLLNSNTASGTKACNKKRYQFCSLIDPRKQHHPCHVRFILLLFL